MLPETRKCLFDIREAIALIQRFVAGIELDQYVSDELLKSGVERQLLVIGEAVTQVARVEPEVAEQITDFQQIISLRNRLVHAYANTDHSLIWEAIMSRLIPLRVEVERVLDSTS